VISEQHEEADRRVRQAEAAEHRAHRRAGGAARTRGS
jgi:hypothetical protein